MSGKKISLFEHHKKIDKLIIKRTGIKAGIVNLVMLFGILIGGVFIIEHLSGIEMGYMFGFAMGVCGMLLLIIFTDLIVKIRLNG